MQVTITERNNWEGETFSYIIEVDDKMLSEIKLGLKYVDNVKIEEIKMTIKNAKCFNSNF